MKIKYISVGVIAVLLITIAILVSENQSKKQNDLLQTIEPGIMTISQKRIISGNIYPKKEVEIKSFVSGTLEHYYVELGQKVKVGDEIAKIKILPELSQVENARKNLRITKIVYENERVNYIRDSILFSKGIISKYDFDMVEKNYFINKEEFESAKNQLYLLEEGFIPDSDISNIIRASANGTIIDLPLDYGVSVIERNNFNEGTTLALIAEQDSFIFRGKIIENDILGLKKDVPIQVHPTFKKDYSVKAYIKKITPRGQMEDGIVKYKIEAVLSLSDSIPLFSGLNATAEYVISEKKDVLAIPEACLLFENDSVYVKVYKDGHFVSQSVSTGISDGIYIEVVSGIDKNEKILKKK